MKILPKIWFPSGSLIINQNPWYYKIPFNLSFESNINYISLYGAIKILPTKSDFEADQVWWMKFEKVRQTRGLPHAFKARICQRRSTGLAHKRPGHPELVDSLAFLLTCCLRAAWGGLNALLLIFKANFCGWRHLGEGFAGLNLLAAFHWGWV